MRLRSSQFVFLLLIACSVQVPEEHALRSVEQAISGSFLGTPAQREAAANAVRPNSPADLRTECLLAPLSLLPGARTAQRTPWTMRPPASDSAAVAVHTGLLRA